MFSSPAASPIVRKSAVALLLASPSTILLSTSANNPQAANNFSDEAPLS